MTGEFHDPLRGPDHSERFWTTVNAAEALPGVPTPLNWAWYDIGTENGLISGQMAIGAEPRGTIASDRRDERHLGIFHGHAALNVDMWRAMADAVPGASGSGFERDVLGAERPGKPTSARPGRYPVVAMKAARAFGRARREITDGAAEHRAWWRAAVVGVREADEAQARAAFADAFDNYENLTAPAHLVATMAAQGLYDALGRACEKAGQPGLESALTTGLGTEEAAILAALWAISRGSGGTEAFLSEYGYQGPGAGELANSSWRDAPELLDPVLERYRAMPEEQGPAPIEARQRQEREEAQARLFAAVPAPARPPLRRLIKLAHSYLPTRESGRGSVLRSVDAARAAAKVVGEHAAEAGRMHRPDDVFMCTVYELGGSDPEPSADELAFRRERWEHYKGMQVPAVWQGVPEVTPIAPQEDEDAVTLSGIGAGGGAVEGIVRVVTDPALDGEIEAEEILVCHTTDPSWASLFLSASAVVIDIGGPISHGAIVARELGIPCVINTKDGSRRLRTGDRVRVDGRAGTVERLASANEPVPS